MTEKPSVITKEYLLGKYLPSEQPDFVEVEEALASRCGMYMRREAYEAFCRMAQEAAKEGIALTVLSAARTFWHQKEIWEAKWRECVQETDPEECARSIMRYTAMPGTSRHHWGTDLDLNSLENEYFENGQGLKTYRWLTDRAWQFGFCRPYIAPGAGKSEGHEEEKWHWSYLPLASPLLEQYLRRISLKDINGFEGSETARQLDVIQRYVLGINKDCR